MRRYVTFESVTGVAALVVAFFCGLAIGESKVSEEASRAEELRKLNKLVSENHGNIKADLKLDQDTNARIVADFERLEQLKEYQTKTKR